MNEKEQLISAWKQIYGYLLFSGAKETYNKEIKTIEEWIYKTTGNDNLRFDGENREE